MVYPAVDAGLGCLTWAVLAYLRSDVRERLHATGATTNGSTVADYPVADD